MSALRAFFCLPLFLLPGPGSAYARFSAFRFFYCPERARPTRVFLPSAFSTARTRPGLRAFSWLPPFLLPGTGLGYARFSAFRFFYCPDRDGVTRVLLLLAFSTARNGPALRAFFCLPPFLLPGPGLPYARFSAFRFFYCPDRDRPTRVFLPFAFSTARNGPALRAFSCLLLFLLPGPGPPYARFSAFHFFYRPDRAGVTRVFLPSAFSTARNGPALRAFYCFPLFLLPGTGRPYARFHDFRFFYCPERDGPTRVFIPSAFSTARTGPGLRAFFCLPLFLPPGPGLPYARFSAFHFFYCPDRACHTRVFMPSAFSTARTGPGLRAFFCFSLFLLPRPGTTYARFTAFRLFYCPDRDRTGPGACFFQLKA